MTRRTIDLNADLGEDPVAIEAGLDAALLAIVSSANVACGGHAGDDATMDATVRAARGRGVLVGAHPGYPDRENFGRIEVAMTTEAIEDLVAAQVARLGAIARALGVDIAHVKPHGALYHVAMRRPEIAEAVARGAARWSSSLVLMGLAGSPALDVWRALGMRVAAEAFADRRYEPDGALRSRGLEGALVEDPEEAAAQAVRIARGDGGIAADTICVHGDTPRAAEIARAVRTALEGAGFAIAAPSGPITPAS